MTTRNLEQPTHDDMNGISETPNCKQTNFRKVYTDDLVMTLRMLEYGNGSVRVVYTATTNDPNYSRLVASFDQVHERSTAYRLFDGCLVILSGIAEIYAQN